MLKLPSISFSLSYVIFSTPHRPMSLIQQDKQKLGLQLNFAWMREAMRFLHTYSITLRHRTLSPALWSKFSWKITTALTYLLLLIHTWIRSSSLLSFFVKSSKIVCKHWLHNCFADFEFGVSCSTIFSLLMLGLLLRITLFSSYLVSHPADFLTLLSISTSTFFLVLFLR